MGHTGGYNPQIMVHHSEGYLSEKWAFCAYFVLLVWSKKPGLVNSIPEGRSLPYAAKERPYKRPIHGIHRAHCRLQSPNHGVWVFSVWVWHSI